MPLPLKTSLMVLNGRLICRKVVFKPAIEASKKMVNMSGKVEHPNSRRRRNSAAISGKKKSYAELAEEQKTRLKKVMMFWLGGVGFCQCYSSIVSMALVSCLHCCAGFTDSDVRWHLDAEQNPFLRWTQASELCRHIFQPRSHNVMVWAWN